ncbi:MAG: Arginine-tRNA ligase [Candidatus Saccharibacteria bacterium GW2011_GWC2_48_9]|nr:MAG: Arginine-tRNA ligase [Candidatus Saccharibacteria bacterium GW2011_GWC2_48_9]HCH34050.1 arginine--tRNA ligase [Candidatus Saccharibacteria bacterium]
MEQISHTISAIVEDEFGVDVTPNLSRPEAQFGDYTTNVAMQLAKQVGQNPRAIAEKIAEKISEPGAFEKVEIAGPGFINITLKPEALLQLLHAEPKPIYSGKKIVLEYSCPNAFKELHTGHLYQTIFGDIMSRLLLVGGAQLQRTSFGGDVGLHVAKCLWGMRAELGGKDPDKLQALGSNKDAFERARWISAAYVRGATAYEEGADNKAEIDELNKTIYGFHDTRDHESPLAQIYWTTRQWSYDYFEAFYATIEVAPLRYYPESETAPVGLKVVKEQLEKGNLKESEGAVVFEGDESKHLHTRVFVTSKGLPTYETKDIGVIWREREDYGFDHRYLITGNDQKEYMRVVFAAAETFSPELAGTMTHLTNGTVRFGDGKKMSSRLGNVTRGIDVIDAVREKVSELVDDKSLVNDVTIGAIKYVFARYRLGGDIAFDLDETVSLQGNSGPYLQYAHARARRILEKLGSTGVPTTVRPEDRALVRKLGEYREVMELATQELAPHHICNYLFELAQEFNRYYEKNRVVGSDHEQHRAGLVAAYADTLRAGLMILGIVAPNKM